MVFVILLGEVLRFSIKMDLLAKDGAMNVASFSAPLTPIVHLLFGNKEFSFLTGE